MAVVMGANGLLESARDAIERKAWGEAAEAFGQAAEEQTLDPIDLEAYADAAWWAGRSDDSIQILEGAYNGYIEKGDDFEAATVAVLLAEMAMRRLSGSVAAGWRSRAERLLEGRPPSSVNARLRVMDVYEALHSGDVNAAIALGGEVIELARSVGDRNTEAMTMALTGRALMGRGDWQEGAKLIDEAAATALSGHLDPRTASNVYCCTIEACRSVGDYRRAAEWTEEADRWMDRNSVEGYPGVCQIRRAELKRLKGNWEEAEGDVSRACEILERYRLVDEVGQGELQLGLIRLLTGDFDAAEATFGRAFEHGADPQPGLALLMLARGQLDEAARSVGRSLSTDGSWDRLRRMMLLPVQARIAERRGDLDTARRAVTELEDLAVLFDRQAFEASASAARGELELAEGRPDSAIPALDRALRLWRELDFPYEAAEVRVIIAKAHLASNDEVGARMELNAARSTFERLGAKPALEQVVETLASLDRQGMVKGRTTATFMFTDIVTSTDLIGVIGDDAWDTLISWHDRELRKIFAQHGGVEANHAGDGFFVVFDSAAGAIDAAVAIQRRLADHRREHGFAPEVRVGVHTGEVTVDGKEYRGQGVHLAARVASAATGEEVVASDAAVEAAGRLPYDVSEGTRTSLKGISDPVVLHTIDWR